MAKCVKVIFFLLLTIVLQGTLSNITTEKVDSKVHAHNMPISVANSSVLTAFDFSFSPVAELASTMQSAHQSVMTRIQRVLTDEYFFCLKSILLYCANRESSLSQHRERIYYTTISYLGRSVSEYYVFALRHIII